MLPTKGKLLRVDRYERMTVLSMQQARKDSDGWFVINEPVSTAEIM
jgi:hypothetical protein